MEAQGKTALVTGGARGIGLACVRELIRNGARVAICDCNNTQGQKALEDIVQEFGEGRAIFIKTDVTNEKELEDAFKVTVSTFKSLDIVLNNAGISELSDWQKAIAVNLSAVVRGTQLALQYMGKNNGGSGGFVCNTASVAGLMPVAGFPVYGATKHGVIGLTRCYGMPFNMEKTGVRVVAVCPGLTDTPLVRELDLTGMAEDDAACLQEFMSTFKPQAAEVVATAVLVLLKTAESGTIWVSEDGNPVYEVEIPEYRTFRKL